MTELSEDQIQNRIVCNRCNEDYTGQMIEIISMSADGNCQMCRAELSGKFATAQPPKPFFKADLPMPPSVNHYWAKCVKRSKGKPYVHVYLSAKAFKFRGEVIAHVASLESIRTHTGRIKAVVTLHGATKRSYDVDNFNKALFDALTYSRVYKDDSQIDELIVKRGEVIKGGLLQVELFEVVK